MTNGSAGGSMTKRVIALFVAVFFVCGAVFAGGFVIQKLNETPIISFNVISDTHVLAAEQIGNADSTAFIDKTASGQKMLALSEPILQTAIDDFIESDEDILLVAGDITEDGSRVSHRAAAREFQRAENAGKKVFVVPGNHDIRNSSKTYTGETATPIQNIDPQDFYELYYNFGYSEAIAQDSKTLSYAADMNKYFRIISIDCNTYELNPETGFVLGERNLASMTQELLDWTVKQVEDAYKAGKTPIAMMHFPVTNHLGDLLATSSSKVNMAKEFCAAMTKAGLEYIFTGHLHSNDIMTYQDKNGILYDIETACLTNYPMPVRKVELSKKYFELSTTFLNGIKEEYIPSYYDYETAREFRTNLFEYASEFVTDSMISKILSKVDIEFLEKLLGYFGVEDEDATVLATDLRNLVNGFLRMPLYGEGMTLEGICKQYGVNIPRSEFASVGELAMDFLKANYYGDEDGNKSADNKTLLKYGLYSAFYRLAHFDLFGRINELNADIPAIDLMPSMELLFMQGKLPVVENDLLLAIGKIEKLQNNQVISMLFKSTSAQTWDAMFSMVKLYEKMNVNLSGLNPALGKLLKDIVALGVDSILDEETKSLNLQTLVEDILFGVAGGNILADDGPSDNFVKLTRVNRP